MMHLNQQLEEPSTSTRVVVLPNAKSGAASMLVAKVVDLMAMSLNAGQLLSNPPLLQDLFLSLAKGIDHAVANNEVPIRSRDLPPLLKRVYVSPDVISVQVGLMMLTMSVQSACKLQWFHNQDTNDLLILSRKCFDCDNFLEINSKRPSWQCPHCKQPVCFVDIRLDQSFVKVLREAEEKVVDVIMSANGSWKEDKDHPAHKYGDSQVRHHGGQQYESLSRITAGRSISLQNHNQTVSAAGNSVPNQNISSNSLGSAFSSKAPVSAETHDNSGQLLQMNSFLQSQSSGADTCSIRPPINQQNQHHWSRSNLNTSEFLRNTENMVNGSVPVLMQPVKRNTTIQTRSFVYQAAHSPRGAAFPLRSRRNSELNSSVVVDEASIRNEELQPVDIAAHALPDWRPTKRMRGSLTGEAFSAAFHQCMIQPTLRAQALRPPSNLVPTPSNAVFIPGPSANAIQPALSAQALRPPSNLMPTTSNAVSIRELSANALQPTLHAQASQPPSNLVPTPSNVASIRDLSTTNAVAARSISQSESHQSSGDKANPSGS